MQRMLLSCATAAALVGAGSAQIGPQPPGSQPVQVRMVEDLLAQNLCVETDLASNQVGLLLISDDDQLMSMTGVVSPLIMPQVVLPMTWRSSLTCATDLPLLGVWAGQKVFLQTLCIDPNGTIAASGVACYDVREPGTPLPRYAHYTGPPAWYAELAITRTPPLPCTFAVNVAVTVNSSDYQLWHQATIRRAEGTDIVLILKEPGPGQGLLDVVETHEVLVDVGIQPAGDLRILIARTADPAPKVSDLVYGQVVQIRDVLEETGQ